MTGRKIYHRKTVDELLFGGYSDTVLSMGKLMAPDPDMPAFDRFGWFYMVSHYLFFLSHVRVKLP